MSFRTHHAKFLSDIAVLAVPQLTGLRGQLTQHVIAFHAFQKNVPPLAAREICSRFSIQIDAIDDYLCQHWLAVAPPARIENGQLVCVGHADAAIAFFLGE